MISSFMIQGGGFDAELKEKPTRDPIVNESKNKLHNTRGTLAMARYPDSAAAQFLLISAATCAWTGRGQRRLYRVRRGDRRDADC